MYRIAAISLFASGAAMAAGERIAVSAGEHGAYSRIAFPAAGGDVFTRQTDRRVRVYNIDQSASYALEDINARNKAHRIAHAAVVSTELGKALELNLNCACSARAEVSGAGRFYIDVYETGEPAAETPAAKTASPPSLKARTNARREDADRLSVEHARQQMVALLEQAAQEGLVTIKDAGASSREATTNDVNTSSESGLGRRNEDPEAALSGSQAARNAAPEIAEAVANQADAAGLKCLPDAAFAIDGARFDTEPLVQIASLQSQFADATGEEATAAMRELAEGYMAIGFGEEALALLTDYGQEDSLYADIARVIADRRPRPGTALAYARNCSGAHALWQAAAVEVDDLARRYQRSNAAILQLPTRLRAVVASRLAMKAVEAQAWPTAQDLADIAAAAAPYSTPELQYIKARLEERRGDARTSRESLLKIASRNSEASDDAVLALAESYIDGGAEPYQGFAEDLGAIARVHESTKAAFAEAKAWSDIGNIEAALLLLQGVAEKSSGDAALARRRALSIADEAFSSANPRLHAAALDAILVHKKWLALDTLNGDRIIEFARAARKQGLPDLAYFFAAQSGGESETAVAYEMASAALDAGMTGEAVRLAAPHTESLRFRDLIANANLRGGRYHAALAAAAALEEGAQKAAFTARAGWLARSWKSAARGFGGLDPSVFDESAALRYALAAYMAKETSLPPIVDAVFKDRDAPVLPGLQSLFADSPGGSALERSRRSVESASKEIKLFEELLNNG